MALTESTVGQLSLDELVEAVNVIYRGKDIKRSMWDVWMHANHHSAGIAEEIRRSDRTALKEQVADFSLWLFTIFAKLQGEIGEQKPPDGEQERAIRISKKYSNVLWQRFPQICPFCFWRRSEAREDRQSEAFRRPCDCASHVDKKPSADQLRPRAIELSSFATASQSEMPHSIDDWELLFDKIFGGRLASLALPEIGLHLMEEMGEVSDAFARTYSYSNSKFVAGEPRWRQLKLEQELADVFSRLLALVHKLRKEEPSVSLARLIWTRYGSESEGKFICWLCQQSPCDCSIIIVPLDRSVEELIGLVREGSKGNVQ